MMEGRVNPVAWVPVHVVPVYFEVAKLFVLWSLLVGYANGAI